MPHHHYYYYYCYYFYAFPVSREFANFFCRIFKLPTPQLLPDSNDLSRAKINLSGGKKVSRPRGRDGVVPEKGKSVCDPLRVMCYLTHKNKPTQG